MLESSRVVPVEGSRRRGDRRHPNGKISHRDMKHRQELRHNFRVALTMLIQILVAGACGWLKHVDIVEH